jgi:hypothetical protein
MAASITASCPRCSQRFQLIPSMRGQHMRCPNCSEVFRVPEEDGPLSEIRANDGPDPGPSGPKA